MAKQPKQPAIPQERKKKEDAFMKDVTDSMSMSMMIVIAMVFFLPRIVNTLGVAQATTREGRTDHRELQAIPALKWIDLIADPPYTAWVNCFIINDGPGVVEIAINHPNDKFVMGPGETRTINRADAEERIISFFYNAIPGQVANLRVTGEY